MKKFTDLTLEAYLHELASPAPVPGGGSVSAYVAALAMGLIQMVGRVALSRKKKPEGHATIQKIIDSIEKTKRDTFQIVHLDPEVYQEVVNASGHPEKMEDALQNSFRLQADLAFLAVMAREWNASMLELVQGSIKNDLLVSSALLEAAFRGAFHTAMINVQTMKSAKQKAHAERAMAELKTRFEKGKSGDR